MTVPTWCQRGAMEANTRAQFEVTLRGNASDKVPLEFENKDHEQHFQKLLEMKVLPVSAGAPRDALPVGAVRPARECVLGVAPPESASGSSVSGHARGMCPLLGRAGGWRG